MSGNFEDVSELEQESAWEDEPFAVLKPQKPPRAVVSVAFAREDFARIARCARANGMKTSEFIRAAALDRLNGKASASATVEITTSAGGFRVANFTETAQSMRLSLDHDSQLYVYS
jgi:hypothetical protein